MSNDRIETLDALAHEIWVVAQLAPGEGILDGVDRIVALLRREGYPAITHCDNCGCDWLDNGLNPVGCPYCELRRETERELKQRQRDEVLRQVLDALGRAHQTAMKQTLKARIPECAEFAEIAQDLDFVVAALHGRLGTY